jgi:hypothetical protein
LDGENPRLGVKIECDEFGDWLTIAGEAFGPSDDGEFEMLATRLRGARLTDLPMGAAIRLCDRVVGSKELTGRYPHCVFEHTRDGLLLAHGETAFFVENDDAALEDRQQFFRDSILAARRSLEPLVADGTVTQLEESVFEDIAYLKYSVVLHDQEILDAELFIEAVESRIHVGLERALVFICHASEDKPFVDRLVTELDRRALHAWYDKREILVGDSIVGRVNEALASARFLIVVLSPRSATKPWGTRELNSTLMRQLAQERIAILPALIANCDCPPLLADLKYADFRESFDRGLGELVAAIHGKRK